MADLKENVIEWVNGDAYMSLTLNQKKHINKIKRIREKHPFLVPKIVENKDGSIWCRASLKLLKLSANIPQNSANSTIETMNDMCE